MKDRIFFPLALLVAAGLVGIAILPGVGRLPSGAVTGDGKNYNEITVSGIYLNKVVAGGDAETRLIDGPNGRKQLYIEVEAGTLEGAPELGPHFRLAADMEVQFAGYTVRSTVRARPADTRGALQMEANYSAGRAGDSGWQVFDLQPDAEDFSFEYDVPVIEGEQGVDYFGIRPVVPDKSRALIVEEVKFERLQRWADE
ncbi:hypothetical protein HAD_04160 [Hyphomonas adhaerens MHS-3]|uniref:Uncharacterized protein n=1 Tax=Hyphomonas adhaerens MHS-3 TaxID=1280949 RepID=A0A069E3S5_9PROT|nr:hypothetical protein [Hyphomonas adhaerens]KCZ84845.1 hypothetical protein HAD_04160 [Hyphomonas adhaerens MHS-3]